MDDKEPIGDDAFAHRSVNGRTGGASVDGAATQGACCPPVGGHNSPKWSAFERQCLEELNEKYGGVRSSGSSSTSGSSDDESVTGVVGGCDPGAASGVHESAKGLLWENFEVTAHSIAQLYKNPQWPAFQAAASKATQLYKDSLDAHRRGREAGRRQGQRRVIRNLVGFMRHYRRMHREDLIAHLCGKAPPPRSAGSRSTSKSLYFQNRFAGGAPPSGLAAGAPPGGFFNSYYNPNSPNPLHAPPVYFGAFGSNSLGLTGSVSQHHFETGGGGMGPIATSAVIPPGGAIINQSGIFVQPGGLSFGGLPGAGGMQNPNLSNTVNNCNASPINNNGLSGGANLPPLGTPVGSPLLAHGSSEGDLSLFKDALVDGLHHGTSVTNSHHGRASGGLRSSPGRPSAAASPIVNLGSFFAEEWGRASTRSARKRSIAAVYATMARNGGNAGLSPRGSPASNFYHYRNSGGVVGGGMTPPSDLGIPEDELSEEEEEEADYEMDYSSPAHPILKRPKYM